MGTYSKAGNNLDNLLELRQAGDGMAAATGYKIANADFNTRYAPASVGTAYTGGTGYKQNNADVGPRFAAKGSRQSALPIDGDSYVAITTRSTASLAFNMKADGTYSITDQTGAVKASGTWLPSGDGPGEYSCVFTQSGFTSGADQGGGSDSYSNGAASLSVLSSTRVFSASATAGHIGAEASNAGTVTLKLYKGATLRSTTSVQFSCSATW